MKERDHSIDIIKFLAVIFISISHMEPIFGKYAALASGGALGDGLFFFCSGYTLLLGNKKLDFANWYKRRINRIYPSVFCWCFLSSIFFNRHFDALDIVYQGGGWFVSAIMVYYVLLYFIKKYMLSRMWVVYLITAIPILGWYFLGYDYEGRSEYFMYGQNYYRWTFYFVFMLMGAHVGYLKNSQGKQYKTNISLNLIGFIGGGSLWAIILVFCKRSAEIAQWQLVSILPLYYAVFCMYRLCNNRKIIHIYQIKWLHALMFTVGGLCLEIYLQQPFTFWTGMNDLFPINILPNFVILICFGYLIRTMGRIFHQTFKEEPYDWKAVFKL